MPLTQCRECGAQVSTEAHSCPHCGVPSPTSPSDALRQGSEPARSTFSRRPSAPQRHRLEPQPAAERNAISATAGRARKYCQHCGNDIDAKAEVCPHCGVRAKSSSSTTSIRRSPDSHFDTNDCGRFRAAATCSWVKLARPRAARNCLRTRLYRAEYWDLTWASRAFTWRPKRHRCEGISQIGISF